MSKKLEGALEAHMKQGRDVNAYFWQNTDTDTIWIRVGCKSSIETESIVDILSQPNLTGLPNDNHWFILQLRIRHVESGFRCSIVCVHGKFVKKRPIPANCYLLCDCNYPSRHQIIIPFTVTRINRRPFHLHRSLRHLNRVVREKRVDVEHVINLLNYFSFSLNIFYLLNRSKMIGHKLYDIIKVISQ